MLICYFIVSASILQKTTLSPRYLHRINLPSQSIFNSVFYGGQFKLQLLTLASTMKKFCYTHKIALKPIQKFLSKY